MQGNNIVVLRNMVGIEAVDTNLEDEVKEECSRYGTVEKVLIHQEKIVFDSLEETVVKLFVRFRDSEQVELFFFP